MSSRAVRRSAAWYPLRGRNDNALPVEFLIEALAQEYPR